MPGPRGVGKTTHLLNLTNSVEALYVSCDNPALGPITLTEIAEACFAQGYQGIVLDEIHFARDWSVHAKSIYDNHPKKKIWLSDSSSLVLRRGTADLSRRFPAFTLPFLSFREYLHLKHQVVVEPFDPFKASLSTFAEVARMTNVQKSFREYLTEGFRPIFLEGDYQQKLVGIIEKTIFFDVPFFVDQIHEVHLRFMNAVIGFLASSPVPTINIDRMATEWSIGKEKLYRLLDVLETVGLLNIVRYKSDHKVLGKGAKILFADPSTYPVLSSMYNIDTVREAFVVTVLKNCGHKVFACKDETQGDFLVDGLTLEIGGRTKPSKGAHFVLRDDIELPARNVLPLWSLGMMY